MVDDDKQMESAGPRSATALLSLWNDVDPARQAEYDCWHALEHVPERVWVPGMIAGTRYVAEDGVQPRYFTRYELQDLACLHSAGYQDLVDHPTPWSACMRPALRNFLRKPGTVVGAAGTGLGCVLSLTRVVWTHAAALQNADWHAAARQLLAAGASLGTIRVQIQSVVPAGPQAVGNADPAPRGHELIVQIDAALASAGPPLVDLVHAQLDRLAPEWRQTGCYRFASRVEHHHVGAHHRPAPRLDLMSAF